VRLHDVLARVAVLEWRGATDGALGADIVTVTHDSRVAAPGTLFCCLPGAHVDGHDFAGAAVAAGADALLVERLLDDAAVGGAVQARVASSRAAMAVAAATCHGDPSRALRVLGVTGTNGKTTTVHLLDAIARATGATTGMIGTVGTRVGDDPVSVAHTTPESSDLQALLARMRDAGVGVVAMEVSSEGIAQHRVDATWFAAACFTNLSQDHLNFHGTMDAYFEAKAMLFDPARIAAAAVNVGDAYGRRLIERLRRTDLPLVTYGVDNGDETGGVDLVARDVELGRDGSTFTLVDTRRARASYPVRVDLVGAHNVANALAAAATAVVAGVDVDAIVAGLGRPIVVPGRMEPVENDRGVTLLVDYAHTPDALARVLGASRPIAATGQLIVVFGCGGDRDAGKRAPMGDVAGRLADVVIVTTDNSRSEDPQAIAREVAGGVVGAGGEPEVELDRRAAIRLALERARAGDVVVIAGKGHETGQSAGGTTRPFDDRIVAREELAALGCA